MQETYPLHATVLRSDLEGVLEAIKRGRDLNQQDDHGNSALHWAVLRGDYDILKVLLEVGSNPNVISSDGYTPRWSAVDFDLHEIEGLLANYGGKVVTNDKFDRTSWSVFKGALGQELPKEDEKKKE
jgi:ankyrin repeat protein